MARSRYVLCRRDRADIGAAPVYCCKPITSPNALDWCEPCRASLPWWPSEAAVSREDYEAEQRRAIVELGEEPIRAAFDAAGNCRICGECGRCPGWHRPDELDRAAQLPQPSTVYGTGELFAPEDL